MHRILGILSVALTGALTSAMPAQREVRPLAERLEQAFLSGTGPKFFGACLIARDGEILLRKGFGAKTAGTPIDAATLFDVASIGKQFTAAAVLLLESERRLSTFDRLEKFFPRVASDKAKITLHQLLTHTSGLPTNIEFDERERDDRNQMLKRVWAEPLDHAPGDAYSYSNLGYHVLGAVIEKVSNRPFGEFMQRRVFRPAGMHYSGFPGDEHLRAAKPAPRWEGRRNSSHDDTATSWPWHWGFRGAAGVITTANDLYRWDRALHDDTVLSDAVRAKFFAPGADDYALGWESSRTERRSRRLSHTGSCYGFQSLFLRFPDDDACVIAVGNQDMKPAVIDSSVSEVLFAEPPPARAIDGSIGRYALPKGRGEFELVRVGDRVHLRPSGVEAVARALHGEPSNRKDPFNRRAFENNALDLLEPLAKGYRSRIPGSFARDTEAKTIEDCEREWKGRVQEHGRCRSVRVVGSDPESATTWLVVRFGSTDTRWKATWHEKHRIQSLEPAGESVPFDYELTWRRDRVFWMRSADGFRDIEIAIVDARGKPELRWRDGSTGDEFVRCAKR